MVVSFDPADPLNAGRLAAFRTHYGIGTSVTIVGGYSGKLSDLGEKVQLQDHDEPPLEDPTLYPALLEDEVVYSNTWGASGNGQSLQRVGMTLWGDDPASWTAAAATPGSVGAVAPATVAGRKVFYNRSGFDGERRGGQCGGRQCRGDRQGGAAARRRGDVCQLHELHARHQRDHGRSGGRGQSGGDYGGRLHLQGGQRQHARRMVGRAGADERHACGPARARAAATA